jgi:hypothetical protein
MSIPIIFGLPLHVWSGILIFLLLLLQVGIGKKIIKIPFKWHKRNAVLIVCLAIIHGFAGVSIYLGILHVG